MLRLALFVVVFLLVPMLATAQQLPVVSHPCNVDGTPIATPEPSENPLKLDDLLGIQGIASRQFVAAGGRLLGTGALEFASVGFDSADHAHAAFSLFPERFLDAMDGDASRVRHASVERLGDETTLYAGELTVTRDENPETVLIAYVVARTGDVLRVGLGVAWATDPSPDTVDVMKRAIDRASSQEPESCDRDGMHHGGLWDTLPILDDLPTGFVLSEEGGHFIAIP